MLSLLTGRLATRLAALSIVLASVGLPAVAQSPAQNATRWGLLGTWMVDCAAPVSRSNYALIYLIRNGRLFHDREWGDGQDSSSITQAALKDDNSIELTTLFTSISQTRNYAFVKEPGGRKRSLFNRNVDTGEYSVRDGLFVSNGVQSPWQTRCR